MCSRMKFMFRACTGSYSEGNPVINQITLRDIMTSAMHAWQQSHWGKIMTKFGTDLREGDSNAVIIASSVVVGGILLYYFLNSSSSSSSAETAASTDKKKTKKGINGLFRAFHMFS
jgi:hypothetical protein